MDGWAGRAVVTANVGLHAGRWTPRTTLFTLADADYVESFIVQWRQRVSTSLFPIDLRLYFCMGCAHHPRRLHVAAIDSPCINACRCNSSCGGNRSLGSAWLAAREGSSHEFAASTPIDSPCIIACDATAFQKGPFQKAFCCSSGMSSNISIGHSPNNFDMADRLFRQSLLSLESASLPTR